METQLRPLTLGEILDRTAQLYRTNFLLFAGIAAVYTVAVLGLGLADVAAGAGFQALHMDLAKQLAVRLWTWPSYALMLILGSVAAAANNRAVAWVYLGEPATISAAYRSIRKQTSRYLWLGTLKVLIAWSPLLAINLASTLSYLHFQGKGVLPQPGQIPPPHTALGPQTLTFLLVEAAIGTVFFPVLIYSVWMGLRYSLAVPASVVENLPARVSLRRSVDLSKGARGGILALWGVVLAVQIILAISTQGFFVFYAMKHHYQMPTAMSILQQVLLFFTNTFVTPMIQIGATLFYFDQRVRKEGFDIEWMMHAAGMMQTAGLAQVAGLAQTAGSEQPATESATNELASPKETLPGAPV